ncbi:hypothetical protein OG742_37360 [Streptomyces sp. NBC_00828]|uniref:hypothetical protein n=1 Tax=Streptomyces sp. NBC_00828 TaxID=2903678 RepID=UPI00386FCAD2
MRKPYRRRPGECGHVQAPHALARARLFPCGWRCTLHTPNALAGKPEPPPGPGLPPGAWTTPGPINDSRIHDQRAIATGKRRSHPAAYRAAQAAADHRTELNL